MACKNTNNVSWFRWKAFLKYCLTSEKLAVERYRRLSIVIGYNGHDEPRYGMPRIGAA